MRPLPYASLAAMLAFAIVPRTVHAGPTEEVLEWRTQGTEHGCRSRSLTSDSQQFAYVTTTGLIQRGSWQYASPAEPHGSYWFSPGPVLPCPARALTIGRDSSTGEPYMALCASSGGSKAFALDASSRGANEWSEIALDPSVASSTFELEHVVSLSQTSRVTLLVGGVEVGPGAATSSTPALLVYRGGPNPRLHRLSPKGVDWEGQGGVTALSPLAYYNNTDPVLFVALERGGVYRVTVKEDHLLADKVLDRPFVTRLSVSTGWEQSLTVALAPEGLYVSRESANASTSTPWAWDHSAPFSTVRDIGLPSRSYRNDARIVAVGSDGDVGRVATSQDGINWELHAVPTSTPPLECVVSEWTSHPIDYNRGHTQGIIALSGGLSPTSSTTDGGAATSEGGVALTGLYLPLVKDAGAPEPADAGAPDAADAGRDTCSVGEEFYPPTQRCEPRPRPSGGWLGGNSVAHGVAGGLLLLWTAVSVLRNRARTKREPAERG